MSMDPTIFTAKLTQACMSSAAYANRAVDMTAIATALGTDTTVHDKTIEAAPTGLQVGNAANTPFQNEILRVVNEGKAGNFPVASMATILTSLAANPPNPIRGM